MGVNKKSSNTQFASLLDMIFQCFSIIKLVTIISSEMKGYVILRKQT